MTTGQPVRWGKGALAPCPPSDNGGYASLGPPYATEAPQTGDSVTCNGQSQTNERGSELLRNTAYDSLWLERPELV